MAKLTSFTELQHLIKALIPGAEVVVDLEDSQVVILTDLYIDLDRDPDLLIHATSLV